MAPETRAASEELAGLLDIDPNAGEHTISFGEVARGDRELAILTSSTLVIMLEMASQVMAPAPHIGEGRTIPSLADHEADGTEVRRLVDIRADIEEAVSAFVAVRYRDDWFWVDDRDFASKRSFAYVTLLSSLTESGGREGLPLVTIPAG